MEADIHNSLSLSFSMTISQVVLVIYALRRFIRKKREKKRESEKTQNEPWVIFSLLLFVRSYIIRFVFCVWWVIVNVEFATFDSTFYSS